MLLADIFSINGIHVQQCHDDADTTIIRAALREAKDYTQYYNSMVEIRDEETDIMVMQIHHGANISH